MLSEQEVESLCAYGINRSEENKSGRAGKNIPSKPELTLMLYKAYCEAEAE